ncbi:GldG family protein [Ruminiclostridium josui]|uniref:GldG family protein n=2 Tax=Ruminiclostridium josui TaxID=1499 RepID=UPI001FA813D6|nr:GldG family protein [Ruminiclostridium josui]
MGKLKFMNKRSLKYGTNSIILVVVVVAIAIVINLLVGMGNFRMDLTADKLYSLSDQSKDIIKKIKKEVTIYGLFDNGTIPGGSEYREITDLVNEYKNLGIKVKYVDPDKDPGTITSLDPQKTLGLSKGDFVVKSGNKVKKLEAQELYGMSNQQYGGRTYSAEPLITGAIKFVASDVTPVAYFVEGHNELSLKEDLNQVSKILQSNNLEVKSLSLLTEKSVPDDCQLLVFASPQKDLTDEEKIKLDAYIKKNGKAIFMFDSLESSDKLTNFEESLNYFNIGINYDKVKENDSNRHLPNDDYALIGSLEENEINQAFSGANYPVFMPDSRSISILKNQKDWLTNTQLITTTNKAESTDIVGGKTNKGPFNLAVAAEISGGSKILVFGNSKFLSDRALASQYGTYFQYGTNYFLTTVVNWMQDKTNEQTISSKIVTPKILTVNESQTKVLSIVLIGVVPLLILGSGWFVWYRRRHL